MGLWDVQTGDDVNVLVLDLRTPLHLQTVHCKSSRERKETAEGVGVEPTNLHSLEAVPLLPIRAYPSKAEPSERLSVLTDRTSPTSPPPRSRTGKPTGLEPVALPIELSGGKIHRRYPSRRWMDFQPRTKSFMIWGAEVSNPHTSNIPPSLGSAMVNSEAVIPTTINFAPMPIF